MTNPPTGTVILSAGPGKLHFHETARAVGAAGGSVQFLTGWVPTKAQRPLVDTIGKFLGEAGLANRLGARAVSGDRVEVVPNTLADFCCQGIGTLSRLNLLPNDAAQGYSFSFWGRATRARVQGAAIFHVRSGAGQGGAIRAAKSRGMRVLTDHSIAHPAYIKDHLTDEYRLAGMSPGIDPDQKLWRLVLRDCNEADLLLVNSEFVRDTFLQYGFPADKIRVAYLGAREQYWSLKKSYEIKGPIKLLFTGNFEVRKGARTLLDAIRLLRANGTDVRLRLIGGLSDGGAAWIRPADREFLDHSPFVPPEQILPALATADLFVFPTLAEGCSRSAMEAAAAGLPVITTEQCGLPIALGDSVRKVPARDPEELARAIGELSADETLRREMGSAASRIIQAHYNWDAYGLRLLQIYQELKS